MNLAPLIRGLRRRGVTMRLDWKGRVLFHPRELVAEGELEVLRAQRVEAIDLLRLPYLDSADNLRIPLSTSAEYRWWNTTEPGETHRRLDAARRCAEAWGMEGVAR